MTNEERERLMEFILQSQANSEVRVQKLEEANAQSSARMSRLEGAFVGVLNMITETAKAQKELTEDVRQLAQAQAAQAQAQAELSKKQAETAERLDIFINVLERYISEGRNGFKQE